ncbi:MAG: TetR family transcriptional regulator [Leeuwenhoekiella sp.]
MAEKLFSENGFDGTSVRNIAKAADINVAMISYYFGSKEKLLGALLLHRTSDFRLLAESVLAKNTSHLDRLDALVILVIKRIHSNRRIYKIIYSEFSNPSRNSDFENYKKQKLKNYKIIEDFVRSGQEAGVFTKNVEISLIYPTIFGTYFHFYYNKPFYAAIHNLSEDFSLDEFVHKVLTPHLQKTIKALLTYEI